MHDVPPPRNNNTLSDLEQQRLEDDLTNVRDQQQGVVKPAKRKPGTTTVIRASSQQTLY